MLLIMPLLHPQNPACIITRLATGARRVALRMGQPVLAVYFKDCIDFGTKAEDVSREIAADAASLGDEIEAACADGKITPKERARLRALAFEIEREAITGEIITGTAEGAK